MPKKKPSGTKKSVTKKKRTEKKAPPRGSIKARRKAATKKKPTAKKPQRTVKRKLATPVTETQSPEPSTLNGGTFPALEPDRPRRGTGPRSAGQSGDLQGLSRRNVDSESVEELAAEGQSYEADLLSGVEDALDPDQGELRTREVPIDDVPEEYTDKD
jgi:hypothetical protein